MLGGWQAAHVIVDNWTNQYLQLTDIGRFVAPGEHGGVYPLPGVSRANASFAAPLGITQPPAAVGVANLVFLSGGINATPTTPIPRTVDQNSIVVTTVDNPIGSGTVGQPFLVPDTSPFTIGCSVIGNVLATGVPMGQFAVAGINPGVSLVLSAPTIVDLPAGTAVVRVPYFLIPNGMDTVTVDLTDRPARVVGAVSPAPGWVVDGVALAFGAHAVATYDFPLTNDTGAGIVVKVGTGATGGTVTVSVLEIGDDGGAGYEYPLLSTLALGASTNGRLRIYPGIPTVANASLNDVVNRKLIIRASVAGAVHNCGVGFSLVP